MPYTYVSLFSSAGVGCYGLKQAGFECIATNELIERRLNIQKINKKCKYNKGYIGGDITLEETQQKIINEINFWKQNEGIKKLDVLMATPPCQGMSTANYKKGDEIDRNSLVVEAIHLINKIQPRVFIFENVRAFLTTLCIDKDEETLEIKECVYKHLSSNYNIFAKVINFMDYGIPSSRPRTIVIGTLKTEHNFTPLNLFPLKQKHVTLRDVIFDLPRLTYGKRDENDLYHSFRIYPQYMQDWIHNLKEGETAFNNPYDTKPYKIVNNERQLLKSGHMGNKFCRMFWDKPAPCITTRNDQLASQSTIHPIDDRVLSIRELMKVMSIPESFKWVEKETKDNIDSAETLIRQSIGEAVPTGIILQIASNIKTMLDYDEFINQYDENINYSNLKYEDNYYIKSFLYEKELSNSKDTGSFYTPQIVVYNTIKNYSLEKKYLSILEPSVGVGAFIPQLLRLIDDCESAHFDLIDISEDCISLLKSLLSNLSLHEKYIFNFIIDDFVEHKFNCKYDLIISNPPYFKMNGQLKAKYKDYSYLKTDNIYCLFIEKYRELSDEVMCVIPKTFLMVPDANVVRNNYQNSFKVASIYDYGVKYFKDVFIEIISVFFSKNMETNKLTHIENLQEKTSVDVEPSYIFHDKMWLLYRDAWFDEYITKLELDVFDFFRDRQITNSQMESKGNVWILKSKNILDDGEIIHKAGYDKYTSCPEKFIVSKFMNKRSILFVSFTYNTRATFMPDDTLVNGSIAVLIPKDTTRCIEKKDLQLFATNDFRRYYSILKNKSKFTLNIDSNVVYYLGLLRR